MARTTTTEAAPFSGLAGGYGNARRTKDLDDQIQEATKPAATISNEINSLIAKVATRSPQRVNHHWNASARRNRVFRSNDLKEIGVFWTFD
jgi:hypothetical protein